MLKTHMPFSYKNINVTKYLQSGFRLEAEKLVVYIDPYKLPAEQPKADYVFLTHEHYDHCDAASLRQIVKNKTVIVGNALVSQKLLEDGVEFNEFVEVEPEMKIDLGDIHFETLPAYNLEKEYHPKKNKGVGYIIHLGEQQIFHLGDSDNIPEYEKVTGVEVAIIPVSGTYVMDVEEAIAAAKVIKPEIAIPVHYDAGIVGSNADAESFKQSLDGVVRVEILEAQK